MLILCAYVEAQSPDVNMEAEIVAVHYYGCLCIVA